MPSSDADAFAPLGGPTATERFRPLGMPSREPARDAPPAPDPVAAAFEAGRARGRADAEAAQAVLARDVEQAVAAIASWRAELRTRYTDTLVALALETARAIVGDALDARPERWADIVAAAIARMVERDRVTVRVAPRLAALLRAHASATLGEVRVVEDATLDDGACRIETPTGDVECGVAAQLAAAADALGATR